MAMSKVEEGHFEGGRLEVTWILCHIFPPWAGGAPCGLSLAAGASLFRG